VALVAVKLELVAFVRRQVVVVGNELQQVTHEVVEEVREKKSSARLKTNAVKYPTSA
jgi:hypothetical protein